MKTFYFVRHGESEHNEKGLLAGWSNSVLSEKGRQQVVKTAERMKDYPIELICSSDLERAKETATAIQTALGVPLILTSALREIHMGDWESKRFDELQMTEAEMMAWFDNYMEFAYPGGESVQQVVDRSAAFFHTLLKGPEEHVALVGHGLTFSALIAHLVFEDYRLSKGIQLHNGGINIVHVDEDYIYLSKLNG